jgi:phenylacetate-CoA ligase
LGFHYGAERLGAAVVPASTGAIAADQIAIMRDYKTTVLAGMPSTALVIATALEQQGLHPEELNLRVGIFGAEPWSEQVRQRIEQRLRITAFDTYGVSELMGPGVAAECAERSGLHVNEDQFIVEVVDPVSLRRCAPGEEGELVFTTIAKEGVPLIRYRTGDLASLTEEPCACGRTFARMSRVRGRTDDLVMAQGVKFFPSQLREVLMQQRWFSPMVAIVLTRQDGQDLIEVRAAILEDAPFFDEISRVSELRTDSVRALREALGVVVELTFVEGATLRQQTGTKGVRVLDNRQL